MKTGRPRLYNRENIVVDLQNLNLTVDEIAEKHSTCKRTIYSIAVEAGIDMTLRSKVIRENDKIKEQIVALETRKRRLLNQLKANIELFT